MRLAYLHEDTSGFTLFAVESETTTDYVSTTGNAYPKAQCCAESTAMAFALADEPPSHEVN